MIRINYLAGLAALTGKAMEDWPENPTVGALLAQVAEQYGSEMADCLPGSESSQTDCLLVLVNGQHIRYLAGLDTPLQAGDEISLIPLIEGG